MNEAALPRRIALIDVWRGVALVAMMTYHGAWDVAYLHLARIDPSGSLPWRLYAHLIAGTFLFLAGVSLVLATRRGLRLGPYLKRLALIAGGAALVSVATYFAMPQGWVYFGILHQIAVASVIALPFLGLPPALTLAVAAAIALLPQLFRSDFFDAPALWWTGFAPLPHNSFDYVPVFPWTSLVLAGVAAGRLAVAHGLDRRLAAWQPRLRIGRLLAFAGRNSLVVYLVHQPVIFGALFLAARLVMPDAAIEAARADCVDRCVASRADDLGCHAYCRCMFEDMDGAGLLQPMLDDALTPADMEKVRGMALTCTAITLPTPAPGADAPRDPDATDR